MTPPQSGTLRERKAARTTRKWKSLGGKVAGWCNDATFAATTTIIMD